MDNYLNEHIDPKAQPFTMVELDAMSRETKDRILATVRAVAGDNEDLYEQGYRIGYDEGLAS